MEIKLWGFSNRIKNQLCRLPETIITPLESIGAIIQYREIMAHALYIEDTEGWNGSQESVTEPVVMVFPDLCDDKNTFRIISREWNLLTHRMKRKDSVLLSLLFETNLLRITSTSREWPFKKLYSMSIIYPFQKANPFTLAR